MRGIRTCTAEVKGGLGREGPARDRPFPEVGFKCSFSKWRPRPRKRSEADLRLPDEPKNTIIHRPVRSFTGCPFLCSWVALGRVRGDARSVD